MCYQCTFSLMRKRNLSPQQPSSDLKSAGEPRRSHLYILLVMAFAAALRLYALGTIPHGFTNDEAQDGLSARQAIDSGLQVFYPENNGREGLYVNLATMFVWSGNTVWAMRLPSALFGILTVWLTYLLASNLFTKRIGILASLFMAASTWHLYNSRLTNRANAAPFFLLLTLFLAVLMLERIRAKAPFIGWALLAGAVYGLGFHTYPSFRVTPLLAFAVWAYYLPRARAEQWWKRYWAATAAFVGSSLVTVAPLALYFWNHPDMLSKRASQVSLFSRPNAISQLAHNVWSVSTMFFWRGDSDWKNNISGQREVFLPVSLLFLVGIGIMLRAFRNGRQVEGERRGAYLLILVWLVVGALPSVLTVDEVHALRLSLMIPSVFLIAAVGANWIAGWLKNKTSPSALHAAVAILIVAVCVEPCYTYFRQWANDPHVAHDFEDWLVDAATEIRDAPREPTKYVAIPNPIFRLPEVPQVILYLTQTSTEQDRKLANIHYVFPARYLTTHPREFCQYVKQLHPQEQVFCIARNVPLRP